MRDSFGLPLRLSAVLLMTVLLLLSGVVDESRAAKKKAKKQELFGTVEFRGKTSSVPKWQRVVNGMKPSKGRLSKRALNLLKKRGGWETLKKSLAKKSELEKIKAVNRYMNKWPYRLDKVNYGVTEYWARPIEFITRSGDCEDYAIAKYYALKELGFTPDRMRIVAVRDSIRGIGHAVLAVYMDDDILILDNQTVLVLSHRKYKHYVPQFSVNEKYRWLHVPKGKTSFKKKKPVKKIAKKAVKKPVNTTNKKQ